MTAFMIVQTAISDPARFARYSKAVVPLIQTFGGALVAKNGVEVLEGDHDERGFAIFEFPSMEAIHAFWESPDYVPVKEIRRGAGAVDVWAVPAL